MAQTQYRNMDKDCEGILPQGKGLHISRKLRKAVAIKLANQFFPLSLSRKYQKKDRDSEKGTLLKSSCSKFIFFNPLSANPTKRPNTLKQFVGKLPTNCLSVFGHFLNLTLKVLTN